MKKTIIRSLVIFSVGGAAGYALQLWGGFGPADKPDLAFKPIETKQQPTQTFTQEQVEQHRLSRFESLTSIADVLSLPRHFDQLEALYSLAGRSDADRLEQLLTDASQLPQNRNRNTALLILIARYAELAPQRARSLLNQLPASDVPLMIQRVYFHWAKMDINNALNAALDEPSRKRQQLAARAIFKAWQYDDPSVLEQIQQRFAGRVDVGAIHVELLASQALLAPQVALEAALQLSDSTQRFQAINRTATEWAQQDPLEAYRFAITIDNQQLRSSTLQTILSTWSQTTKGAEAAFEVLSGEQNSQETLEYMATVLRGLASEQPERAFELANQLPAVWQQQIYGNILGEWGRKDLRGALEKFDELFSSSPQSYINSYQLINQYTTQYPDEALDWALQKNGSHRRQLVSTVLRQLAQNDPELAINAALSLPNKSESTQLLSSILGQIAFNNPELAASYINDIPDRRSREQAMVQIISPWARSDPDAAFNWIMSLDGDRSQRAMQQLGGILISQAPDKAESLLPQLTPSDRQQWTPQLAAAKARNNPQQAIDWIQQFSADNNYSQLVQAVVAQWSQEDPLSALNYVAKLPERQQQHTINLAISSWANTDVEQAANWVSQQADDKMQDMVVMPIAMQWARQDIERALQWTESLSSNARDTGISMLISTSDALEPERALDLLKTIENKSRRSQAISSLFYRQVFTDREAATELLDHPDLNAADKKRLQSILENGNLLPGLVPSRPIFN